MDIDNFVNSGVEKEKSNSTGQVAIMPSEAGTLSIVKQQCG